MVDIPELQARSDEDEGQIPYMSAPVKVYLGYKGDDGESCRGDLSRLSVTF